LRVAYLEEERLDDLGAAAKTYELALAELRASEGGKLDSPAAVRALSALERIYAESKAWPQLVAVFEQRLALAADPDTQAGLHLPLGSISETRRGEAGRALDAYRQALRLAASPQGQRAAQTALERLLDHPEHAAAAARLLVPLYERESDAARLARGLEILLVAE